jgi:hypothetical protein
MRWLVSHPTVLLGLLGARVNAECTPIPSPSLNSHICSHSSLLLLCSLNGQIDAAQALTIVVPIGPMVIDNPQALRLVGAED